MTYPNSMKLMELYFAASDKARSEEDYERAIVFTTAADLTDGLLKGYPADGPSRLAAAFSRNLTHASEVESTAWETCLQLLQEAQK